MSLTNAHAYSSRGDSATEGDQTRCHPQRARKVSATKCVPWRERPCHMQHVAEGHIYTRGAVSVTLVAVSHFGRAKAHVRAMSGPRSLNPRQGMLRRGHKRDVVTVSEC